MTAKGKASADTARVLRRRMLAEELEKSARVRAEAGVVPTVTEPGESEKDTIERWERVARR